MECKKPLQLPLYIAKIIRKIALEKGFKNFDDSCIDLNVGSNQNDGLYGNLIAVKISEKDNAVNVPVSDKLEPVHLLCKMMPAAVETRAELNMVEMFKREVFFYQTVIPSFKRFQEVRGFSSNYGFFGFPKCYACISDEKQDQFVIVMEDLRPKNYRMWPKKQPVDIFHVQEVLREMAKFHAVSFAMRDQDPKKFFELTDLSDMLRSLMQRRTFIEYFNSSHGRAFGVLERTIGEFSMKFHSVWQNSLGLLDQVFDGKYFEPYSVLVHGDCWNNNTLFRYNKNITNPDQPEDVCFVDWQFLSYNSPALDVLNYIFTATDKGLRDEYYVNLIQLYHSTLCETIDLLGSNANKLYPFDVMIEHLMQFGAYTYLNVPLTIDLTLADPGDIIPFDELIKASHGNVEHRGFLNEFGAENTRQAYYKRITDIAKDLIEMRYIN